MEYRRHLPVFGLLVFFLAEVTSQAQLVCFICDNCAQIAPDTPLKACNAEYFSSFASTLPATMTTTTTEQGVTDSSSSTTDPTTMAATTVSAASTTMEPTPPTIGPPITTTPVPTPPNVSVVLMPVNTTMMSGHDHDGNMTATAVPNAGNTTEFHVRQARQVMNADKDFTYHCYRVQKTVNGAMTTERGCSRVKSNESVCQQVEMQHHGAKLSKCFGCTNPRCNGSSALGVSMLTVVIGVVAFLLSRK